jgi:hypothetical protein
MNRTSIPVLAELLGAYYSPEELRELALLFDVNIAYDEMRWMGVARRIVEEINRGNNRLMLDTVLEQVEVRRQRAFADAGADSERRTIHAQLYSKIAALKSELGKDAIPRELALPEDKPFAAKSEVRDFLEKAETGLLVVDPYVGVGTLDCLRSLKVPVRLLTGVHAGSVESGFDVPLRAFQDEGFQIEVRQHPKLHDRHIAFNERCWLVGSSLKDAGRKAFHAIEIVDAKREVIAALEAKWHAGTLYSSQH